MNIVTQICGFMLLMLLYVFIRSQKSLGLYEDRIFLYVLCTTMVSLVLDIMSVLLIIYSDYFPEAIVIAVAKLYVSMLTWDGWMAFVYMMLDVVPERVHRRFVGRMATFNLCITAVTLLLPIETHYDGNLELYTDGPSTIVVYASAALYSALIIISVIIERKKINPRKLLGMVVWVAFLVGAAVIQFFFKELLIITFAMALGVLIIFVLMENPERNIDRNLGCFNSYAKSVYYNKLWDKKTPFSVLKVSFSSGIFTAGVYENEFALFRTLLEFIDREASVYVFKENDLSLVIVADDSKKAENLGNSIITGFFKNPEERANVSAMFIGSPYLLESAADIDRIFAFADEGSLTTAGG